MTDSLQTKLTDFYGRFPEILEVFREVCGDETFYDQIDEDDLSDYVANRAFETGDEVYTGFFRKLLLDRNEMASVMREYLEYKMRLTGSITTRTPSQQNMDPQRTLTEAEVLDLPHRSTREVSASRLEIPPAAMPTSARITLDVAEADGTPTQVLPIRLEHGSRISGPSPQSQPPVTDPSQRITSAQTVILPANGGQRDQGAAPVAERLSELPPVEQRLSDIPSPPSEPKVIIAGHSLITHKSVVSEGAAPRAVATPLGAHSRSSGISTGTGPSREQARTSAPPPAPPPPTVNEENIRSGAAQLVQKFLAVKKHTVHYDVWRDFRKEYFDLVYKLEQFLAAVSRIERGPFLPENRRAILDLAHACEILASRVLEATVEKVTNPPASPEHALIFAQRNMINGTRNLIRQLSQSIAKFEDTKAANDIKGFLDNWRQQRNPLRWAFGFTTGAIKHEIVSRRRVIFNFAIPQGTPMLAHNKPHVLLNLMDRIFFRALKKKVPLKFEFIKATNELSIANKKQLKTLRRDKNIAALVRELDGRWDLPGRTRRFFRSLFRRARKGYPPYHRLLIPLTAANGNGLSGSRNGGVSNPPANGNGRLTPAEGRKLGEAPTIAVPVPPPSTSSVSLQAVSAMNVFSPASMLPNIAPSFPMGPLPALQFI